MSGKLWTCNGCGLVALWGEAWSYYGNIEGKRGTADILFVACSQACMDTFTPPAADRQRSKPKSKKARERAEKEADAAYSDALGTLAHEIEDEEGTLRSLLRDVATSVRRCALEDAGLCLDAVEMEIERIRERIASFECGEIP